MDVAPRTVSSFHSQKQLVGMEGLGKAAAQNLNIHLPSPGPEVTRRAHRHCNKAGPTPLPVSPTPWPSQGLPHSPPIPPLGNYRYSQVRLNESPTGLLLLILKFIYFNWSGILFM